MIGTDLDGFASSSMGAIGQLAAGNRRFLDVIARSDDPEASVEALARADPYAVVLGCSDSRVPPELVFDESVGRLFVVRVASHVAGSDVTGTIEYALARWDCPLVVVLGHTQCAAIAAAMDTLPPGAEKPPDTGGSTHLGSLLGSIRSHLGSPDTSSADQWTDAARSNVRRTMEHLLTWSMPVHRRVDAGQLKLVGAIYHVETGEVEFLDVEL